MLSYVSFSDFSQICVPSIFLLSLLRLLTSTSICSSISAPSSHNLCSFRSHPDHTKSMQSACCHADTWKSDFAHSAPSGNRTGSGMGIPHPFSFLYEPSLPHSTGQASYASPSSDSAQEQTEAKPGSMDAMVPGKYPSYPPLLPFVLCT